MKLNLICLVAMACPVLTLSSAYAAGEEERVSAVILLQDSDVAFLKQTGYIKMAIPPTMIDRVDSVTLKRPVRFKDEAAVLFNDVDRRNAMISVSVDDATMEQIDYQPVVLKIYESGFSSIVVQYRPGNATLLSEVSKDDSDPFVISLNNTKSLSGRLADMKEFAIKSELGEVDVALKDVSQITFDDDRAIIQMNNGDQLSGEINFRNITVKNRWGLEDLDVADIASVARPLVNVMADANVNMASSAIPMSVPQVSLPHPPTTVSGYSQPGNFSYLNNHRVDIVPAPIMDAYDPYVGQQMFDQAVDHLMQPTEMMPIDQQFGPFFGEATAVGEPIPYDEQSVGGAGEMIQNLQEIPSEQGGSPSPQNDFWFFPQ